jgi:hypothetical protein
MLIASQFLGHNRINIMAEHYLRYLLCPQDLRAYFRKKLRFKIHLSYCSMKHKNKVLKNNLRVGKVRLEQVYLYQDEHACERDKPA